MKNAKYLIIIPLAFIFYFLFFRSPEGISGDKAPNFKAELIDGSQFELKDLQGKYIILDFWGSWCGPCRRDNPNLVKLYESHKDSEFEDASGFEIVTVALEKNKKMWKKASDKDGFSWPYQIVTVSKVVLLSPIAQKYNVSNVPTKFLIDPSGNIISVNQKYQEIDDYLRTKLKK